jgi:CubicO group peptidase (beta-lactamase class C family)
METPMAKRWLSRNPQLFSGAPQAQHFREFVSAYPVRVIRRSDAGKPLAAQKRRPLPKVYEFDGHLRGTWGFLAETETTGLLVLVDGLVVYEAYRAPLTRTVPWPCWSVSKSFVALLVGIAIDHGFIAGVDAVVSDIAPELVGSGYDGVSLHDVLTMSSGVRWSENYADPQSDTRRHGFVHATGGSLDAFAATLPREWEPGTRLRYNSIDTNVLGLVLRRATGRFLSDLMHEWLWQPLGAESEAFMAVDGEGAEWAGAGLICTLRDRARLGLLVAANGALSGAQIVSADWVQAATRPGGPHLTPEDSAAKPFGYGYQFWLHEGACAAIGIYNQYCWVDASRRIVIAKASANRNFGRSFDEAGYRDLEHMALFQAIASYMTA